MSTYQTLENGFASSRVEKEKEKKKGERKKRHLLKKSRTNRLTASPMPKRLCYENIRLRGLNFIVK